MSRIAILGSAPSSRMLAPFDDLSWDIWACSPGNCDLPRIDRFYEIHALHQVLIHDYFEYCVWMRKFPGELWMQTPSERFPQAKIYPIAEVLKKFPPDFYTSSPAYMVMHALLDPTVEEIGFWGIDMNAVDEYNDQRPALKYFLDVCKRKKIKVTIPVESDLRYVTPPYAYRDNDPLWIKLQARRQEIAKEIAIAEDIIYKAKTELIAHKAGLETLDYVINTFVDVFPNRKLK